VSIGTRMATNTCVRPLTRRLAKVHMGKWILSRVPDVALWRTAVVNAKPWIGELGIRNFAAPRWIDAQGCGATGVAIIWMLPSGHLVGFIGALG
jgi:hypothetical protein